MRSLDSIRRRTRVIQTTSKITSAMKLVATAKIKKQRKEFETVSEFSKDLYDIVRNLVIANNDANVYKHKDPKEAAVWVVVTSSLGLCGAYNINICKHLIQNIKPNDKVFVIGRKGFAFLNVRGFESNITDFIEVDANATNYLELLPMSEVIIDLYKNGEVNQVNLVYTKFVNSLTFNPITTQILPLSKELFAIEDKKTYTSLTPQNQEIRFESQVQDIVKSIIPIYVTSLLYAAVSESRVCESAARRNAMETASDNARNLIEELTLEYNRARQENITQEINEIVAGANE